MKVFITASSKWTGLFWKEYLERHGHMIVSTWHDRPFFKLSIDDDKTKIADFSFEQIKDSDIVLLIDDPDTVPGGKFVDAGFALGLGKKVVLVGRRENLKMHSSSVLSADTPTDVTKLLTELG